MKSWLSEAERFNKYIDKTDTCWLWTGAKMWKGYGHFRLSSGKVVRTHRYSYQIWVGDIPEGQQIHHTCDVPACVNPEHLTAVEHSAHPKKFWHATKTHCNNGHPLSGDNLRKSSGNTRVCKACHLQRNKEYRERKMKKIE